MVRHTKPPSLKDAVKNISEKKGSPCIGCIVTASCTKSFVDESACLPFVIFIQKMMEDAGIKIKHKGK